MTTDWTLSALRSQSRAQLESLWHASVELSPPRGVYWGQVLLRIEHATSQRPLWRWSERIGFEWLRFGIDFDRRLWFFFRTVLAMGRFDPRSGPSRWRDTDAIGLHYEGSRLPTVVKRVLYDEVKPVSEGLMLGIGGINAERGVGDHFYFALQRNRLQSEALRPL